ncbi:type II secretion system protein N [Ottowia sp. GY511]|uniref:Type II secretion system protein N n=1 Tax=Ottowia flava TaxID=2675430 RepID=A0ABW4KWF9_9BURK|nr:type II secretion system protein N [Ottowia sp. GY511]TXK29792.1 type II secretion system protein N [Ottowia sp. GY511]
MKIWKRGSADPGERGLRAPWAWAVAGALLGLLAVVVVTAPARWLAQGVYSASRGMVQLTEPAGSLWAGSARLVLTGGAGSQDVTALPGRVQWRLRPDWTGVRAAVTADCCTPNTPLDLAVTPLWGGGRVRIADAQSQWPAAVLTGLGTPWNTVQPQGELALSTRGLQVESVSGRLAVAGALDVTLRHLSSRLSTVQPLGSYRVQVQGGDAVSLQLSTLDGALRLSGDGQWVGSRLRFKGEATAAPGLEAQLANLLNILGRRQGERAIISIG